jgi:hypothetical protein
MTSASSDDFFLQKKAELSAGFKEQGIPCEFLY